MKTGEESYGDCQHDCNDEDNPTKKTLLKVTMSMVTTMTTVPHRDLEKDWSSVPFCTVQFACIQIVYLVFTVLLPPP